MTRFFDQYTEAKISNSGVWDEAPDGSTLILEIPDFSFNTVYDIWKEAPMPKPARFVQPFQ